MECIVVGYEKKFLSGYPLRKWCWQGLMKILKEDIEDKFKFQRCILRRTVCHPLMETCPLNVPYRVKFLKILINKLEESNLEICDEIYETYCNLLERSGNPELHSGDKHFRHFLIHGKFISLRESASLVSEGTTGLHAWQASMALSEWCLQHQETLLKNKKVLELGSGVGFTGLACLLGTAGHCVEECHQDQILVEDTQHDRQLTKIHKDFLPAAHSSCAPLSFIFSDCHPSVLQLLCGNIRQNLLEGHSSDMVLENSEHQESGSTLFDTNYNGTKVKVVNLPWENLAERAKEAIEIVAQINVVIAADVVYDHSLFEPLIGSLKHLIEISVNGSAAPKIVLACTKRNPLTLKKFMDTLTAYGLCAHEEEPVQPQYFEYDPDPPVGIYVISSQKCE